MRILAAAACVLTRVAVGLIQDCDKVVYEGIDATLKTRTMVVQDEQGSRMLVLTPSDDTSEPCTLKWWLEHNPQGTVQCRPGTSSSSAACDPAQCRPDPTHVELGYVRSMLASAFFTPPRRTPARPRQAAAVQAATSAPWVPRARARRMLVIGLGSSTMALWFRHQLPGMQLDIAELVPGVVAAAPCFGLNPQDSNLTLHTGDGRAFLEQQPDSSYDAILVDAFDSSASLPLCFRSKEFFGMARRKLVAGGALSFNLLSNKMAPRILKSMAASFGLNEIWVGDAPGAEGVQNVITAFSGPASLRARGDEAFAVPEDTVPWFQRMQYASLSDRTTLESVQSFDDDAQCHYKN